MLDFLVFVRLLTEQLGCVLMRDLQLLLLAIQLGLRLLKSGSCRLLLCSQLLKLLLVLLGSPIQRF